VWVCVNVGFLNCMCLYVWICNALLWVCFVVVLLCLGVRVFVCDCVYFCVCNVYMCGFCKVCVFLNVHFVMCWSL